MTDKKTQTYDEKRLVIFFASKVAHILKWNLHNWCFCIVGVWLLKTLNQSQNQTQLTWNYVGKKLNQNIDTLLQLYHNLYVLSWCKFCENLQIQI